MDKITRMLLLHSKLIQGEKVNKSTFCMEADCLPRSFDRDIEDIRLYLSETFHGEELIYDRYENVYYLSGTCRKELETMEYQLIERILLDTAILRQDEMDELLQNLASNINKGKNSSVKHKDLLSHYEEPLHNKALLKMHGDLAIIIRNRSVIKIKYTKMNGIKIEREIVPCSLKYDMGYLYLIAYLVKNESQYPAYFRLDRIHSFEVMRNQLKEEKQQAETYLRQYSKGITHMYGGEFTEITLSCKRDFYSYVHDKFRKIQVLKNEAGIVQIKLWAFDDGFVKWIISQPPNMICVEEPLDLQQKIIEEAEKIIAAYSSGTKSDKEN